MQYRINNRGPPITSEYTNMFNLQFTKLQNNHKNKEIKDIK